MSTRSSSSPALHLRIAKSLLRARLFGALCLVTACALGAIYSRGYPLLAILLMPLVSGLLWRLRQCAMEGAILCYRQGEWTLLQGDTRRQIDLTQRSTSTLWVIYLAFRELPSRRTGQIWLFKDSSSAEELRRLRVRVALLR